MGGKADFFESADTGDAQQKSICAIAFDYDGCMVGGNYEDWLSKSYWAHLDVGINLIMQRALYLAHEKLWKHLSATLDSQEIKILLGSARQSLYLDKQLSVQNRNGSAIHLVTQIVPVMQYVCPKLTIQLDQYLLANDFVNYNREDCITDAKIDFTKMQDLYRALNLSGAELLKYPNCPNDHSKFLMLYAHVHRLAIEYPNCNIVYRLYDDDERVIQELSEIVDSELGRVLLPKIVTIELYQYGDVWRKSASGKDEFVGICEPKICCQKTGAGEIDRNYKNNLHELARKFANYEMVPVNYSHASFNWNKVKGKLVDCINHSQEAILSWANSRTLELSASSVPQPYR